LEKAEATFRTYGGRGIWRNCVDGETQKSWRHLVKSSEEGGKSKGGDHKGKREGQR